MVARNLQRNLVTSRPLSSATVNDCSREFQERRSQCFAKVKKSMYLVLVAGLLLFFGITMKQDPVGLVGMGILFFVIFSGTIVFYRGYRCPSCETIPMISNRGRRGINLNPYNCEKCDAVLGTDSDYQEDPVVNAVRTIFQFIGFGMILFGAHTLYTHNKIMTSGLAVNASVIKVKVHRGSKNKNVNRYKVQYFHPDTKKAAQKWIRGIRAQALGQLKKGDAFPAYAYKNELLPNVPILLWGLPALLLLFGGIFVVVARRINR